MRYEAIKRESKNSVGQSENKFENPEMQVVLVPWIQDQWSNGYRVTGDIINPTLTGRGAKCPPWVSAKTCFTIYIFTPICHVHFSNVIPLFKTRRWDLSNGVLRFDQRWPKSGLDIAWSCRIFRNCHLSRES